MLLRAVQEFVVHIQSFRNIDIWYQGAYLLAVQIYAEDTNTKPAERLYAHPFAFTEHYFPGDPQNVIYDSQVLKGAAIDHPSSSFMSKPFLLRYYEEEVELNDICHFRVESEISQDNLEYVLEVNLLFFDHQIKKVDTQAINLQRGKKVKTKRYLIRQSKRGVHDYIQTVFEGQYYSQANIMVHSVCLDYRMRMSSLQLFEFSRLDASEKKKLLDRNRKMQNKQISYLGTVAKQLKIAEDESALPVIEQIVLKETKEYYGYLLKEYSQLFAKVITEQHRKDYGHLLVHPSQLGLYEEESIWKGATWKEQALKRYRSNNHDEVIEKMLNQSNLISSELIKLWHHYIDLLKISPRFTTAYYQSLAIAKMTSFWENYFRQEQQKTNDYRISSNQNDNANQKLQKQLFTLRDKSVVDWRVVSEELLLNKKRYPLIVQNNYSKEKHKKIMEIEDEIMPKSQVTLHLVVLVHGFQGNSLDMKLIKNTISVMYPETAFLCSTSNEEMTDTDIIQMGHRLAAQVKNHIIQFFPPQTLERISFIGHSLGGVIIRAALPRLLDFKHKFHTLMTFSSPHIGYKVNASSVIQAGIWVLQKVKNSNCLKQLTMHDQPDPRETCLYRISKFQGPKYFRNIYLFSSKQDSYAPYESARIQIHPEFMNAKDPLYYMFLHRKQVHCQMVKNILEGVSEAAIRRIRVNFTIGQTSIDSIIGRTAHILFLQNSQLIQAFLHTHPDLFQ